MAIRWVRFRNMPYSTELFSRGDGCETLPFWHRLKGNSPDSRFILHAYTCMLQYAQKMNNAWIPVYMAAYTRAYTETALTHCYTSDIP